jgi:multiple sugar transport system permease protein
MVFAAMFNIVGTTAAENPVISTYGIINNIIMMFGGDPINWINAGSTYETKLIVVMIYIIWNALPFKILILLGALQSVNKQYYDAAKIDGTGKVRTFVRITIPLLSPMITYVVITGFIGGFKEYSSVVGIFDDAMARTGQLNTMVGLIYTSITNSNTGVASAAALILFAIIFVITMINLAISKKTTYY